MIRKLETKTPDTNKDDSQGDSGEYTSGIRHIPSVFF